MKMQIVYFAFVAVFVRSFDYWKGLHGLRPGEVKAALLEEFVADGTQSAFNPSSDKCAARNTCIYDCEETGKSRYECMTKICPKDLCKTKACAEATMKDGTCCLWSNSRFDLSDLATGNVPDHPEECCEGEVTMNNECPPPAIPQFADYYQDITSGRCEGETFMHEMATDENDGHNDAGKLCAIAAAMKGAEFRNFGSEGPKMMNKLANQDFPLGCSFNPARDKKIVYYNPINPKFSSKNSDASRGKQAICLKAPVSEALTKLRDMMEWEFEDYFQQKTSAKCKVETMIHEIGTDNNDAAELCAIAASMMGAEFQNFGVKGITMMRKLAKAEFPLGCSLNPDKKGEKVVYYNPMNPNMSPTDADASEGKQAICLKGSQAEVAIALPGFGMCAERNTCIYNCEQTTEKNRYECMTEDCLKSMCDTETQVSEQGPWAFSVSGMDASFVVSVFAFIGAMTLVWYAARALNKTYVNSEFTAINKEVP